MKNVELRNAVFSDEGRHFIFITVLFYRLESKEIEAGLTRAALFLQADCHFPTGV